MMCTSKVVNPLVNCEVLVDGKAMTETCVKIDNFLHQFLVIFWRSTFVHIQTIKISNLHESIIWSSVCISCYPLVNV